jgi:ketosteroid isomerase-like protein
MPQRPGYRGVRRTEVTQPADDAVLVHLRWVRDDGSNAEPFVIHLVTVRDGRIAHIQGYRRETEALKASRRS